MDKLPTATRFESSAGKAGAESTARKLVKTRAYILNADGLKGFKPFIYQFLNTHLKQNKA